MAIRLDPDRDAELIKRLGISAIEDQPKKRPPKYRNRRFKKDGINWDSEHEYFCFLELQDLLSRGVIKTLERQKPIPLMIGDSLVGTYVADFVITLPGSDEWFVIDAKSEITCRTQSWRRTVKHVKAQYGKEIHMALKGKTNCSQIVVQIKNDLLNLDPAAKKPIQR